MSKSILLRVALACITSLATLSPSVSAQDYSTYNTVRDPDKYEIDWAAFYREANELTAETRKLLKHHLDIPYGDDPKQRLDVYLPVKRAANAPVHVFFHGGGFMEGDRAHYGYIAAPYARRGIITVVPSYRLTSGGFHYPAQAEDAKAVVAWVYDNISKFGGNPQNMILTGHSAGAILIADIGVDRRWLTGAGIPAGAIKGIAPVSGDYDISPGERPAYTPTRELEVAASPMKHIVDPAPSAVVAYGSKETARSAMAREFVAALAASGAQAKLVALAGQDHADAVLSLGTEGTELFDAVVAMVE